MSPPGFGLAAAQPAEENGTRSVKCVLVGDAAVGKTSLIVSYTTNGYRQHYEPTAFDNYSVMVQVDEKPIRLQLCDTAGQSSFDPLRPFCYPDSDVFLVVYSVVDHATFVSARDHWLPEVTKESPSTPVVLVGTKADLRWCNDPSTVSTARGKALASQLGTEFYECSALTQHNLKEMFDSTILAGLRKKFDVKKPAPQSKKLRIKQGFQHFLSITKKLI